MKCKDIDYNGGLLTVSATTVRNCIILSVFFHWIGFGHMVLFGTVKLPFQDRHFNRKIPVENVRLSVAH